VFERIDQELTPMRAAYEALINNPGKIETIFQAGAVKARAIATPFMAELRHAVGLRDLRAKDIATAKTAKVALPVFKQYRRTRWPVLLQIAERRRPSTASKLRLCIPQGGRASDCLPCRCRH